MKGFMEWKDRLVKIKELGVSLKKYPRVDRYMRV
jgi:hypothetical protein